MGSTNLDDLHEAYSLTENRLENPAYENDAKTKAEGYLQAEYKAEEYLPPNLFTGASSYQDQQTVRKGQKETFYCEFCLIELNSRDTLLSHTKGQKHIRKVEDHNERIRRGQYVEEKQVRPIANPLPLQKKVPVRLTEKLRETTTAIVGLDSVHEIIACSNAEVEPYYECTLCGQQGEANAMFQHLQGKPHRAMFLQEKYPDNRRYIEGTLNAGFLEREIERLNLRENNALDKINTMYSDEMFPWTAGKAPWSVEQGGTGVVPTRARNRVGLICQNAHNQGFGKDKKDAKSKCLELKDIDPQKMKIQIKTDGDRKRACVVVQKLNQEIRDYTIENGRANPYEMELLFDQIDAIMECVPLKDAVPEGAKRSRASSPARTSPQYREPFVKTEKSRSPSDYNGYHARDHNEDRYGRHSYGRERNGRSGSREEDYRYDDRERHRSSRYEDRI